MIDLIKNEELKIKQEDLLKNMKMLRHTVADMLGSNSFLKGLKPGAHNGIIGIDGETFPVYITANTLVADVLPEITDDIYDEENYLSLVSDDDLMWYALVEHLGTKMENLWKENEELKDENEKLKKKLFCGVPTKFGEQERGTPEDKVVRTDMETALMQQQIAQLNTRIAQLEEKLHQKEDEDDLKKRIAEYAQKNDDLLERNKILRQENTKLRVQLNSYSGVTVVDNKDMQQTITKEAMAELTAKINELEEKLKDKDAYINQLSKNNAALSVENKNFGDMLKNADRDARFYAREADHLRQENDKIYSILNDVVQNRKE